jgi:serine/threonine protein kinase
MDHPNVIQVYEFFDEEHYFALVTEISKGGDILEKLTKLEKFKERDAIELVKTLLKSVAYLHENGIVH